MENNERLDELTTYILGFCPEKGRGNAILSVEGELTILGKELVRGLRKRMQRDSAKFQREFRVVWQLARGHATQTRYYQTEGPARKFYETLGASCQSKRFEIRSVGNWIIDEGVNHDGGGAG